METVSRIQLVGKKEEKVVSINAKFSTRRVWTSKAVAAGTQSIRKYPL